MGLFRAAFVIASPNALYHMQTLGRLCVFLSMLQLSLRCDVQGAAIREPILLPDKPVAAALTPAFVVAVTDDAILVFDSSNCQLVRQGVGAVQSHHPALNTCI